MAASPLVAGVTGRYFEDVAEAVTAAAVDKLTVANPAHLALQP